MVSHFEIPAPFRPKEGITLPFILWEEIIQHSTTQRHSKWTPVSAVKSREANRAKHSWKPQMAIGGSLSLPGFLFSCVSECQWAIMRGILPILCSLLGPNWTLPEEKVQLSNLVNIPLQTEGVNFSLAVQYQTSCVLLMSKLHVKVWLPLGLS